MRNYQFEEWAVSLWLTLLVFGATVLGFWVVIHQLLTKGIL